MSVKKQNKTKTHVRRLALCLQHTIPWDHKPLELNRTVERDLAFHPKSLKDDEWEEASSLLHIVSKAEAKNHGIGASERQTAGQHSETLWTT